MEDNQDDSICVSYITTRNGKKIFAADYGFRCFPIKIKSTRKKTKVKEDN
jgi:hypothetical protein